jgi:AraC-like DNA-binding protein
MSTAPLDSIALGRFDLRGRWGIHFDAAAVAGVHVVLDGTCVVRPSGGRPIALCAGDVLMLPRGSSHALSFDRSVVPTPFSEVRDCAVPSETGTWSFGDGETTTTLLCGVYRFDPVADHPVLRLLPKLVVSCAGTRSPDSCVPSLVALLVREIGGARPGSRTMVARALDMLFVEIVRDWATAQPPGAIGWLGALHDPRVASALVALHADPGAKWTLGTLARRAGMSEATLKRQFTALVGEPPLTYLARVRIDHAARLLRTTTLGLAEVAERVGYQNESSFGRAFRRWRRLAPGQFRESSRTAS